MKRWRLSKRSWIAVAPTSKAIVLAIAYDESRWLKNLKHKDKNQKGVGGVAATFWSERLAQNKINIDSLKAIEFVWCECLFAKRGNFDEALQLYKGTSKNKTSYARTKKYYEVIKGRV